MENIKGWSSAPTAGRGEEREERAWPDLQGDPSVLSLQPRKVESGKNNQIFNRNKQKFTSHRSPEPQRPHLITADGWRQEGGENSSAAGIERPEEARLQEPDGGWVSDKSQEELWSSWALAGLKRRRLLVLVGTLEESSALTAFSSCSLFCSVLLHFILDSFCWSLGEARAAPP